MQKTLAFLAAASLSVGCLSARPPEPPRAQAPVEGPHHVYRLDFVVASNDPGKSPTSSAYTLNLEEYDHGEVHMGTNIALGNQMRQDVGLKITASVRAYGDDLVLRDDVEMSSVDDTPATIHKVTAQGDAVLRPGHPTLVASLEDPGNHRHYEVTAAVTMLR